VYSLFSNSRPRLTCSVTEKGSKRQDLFLLPQGAATPSGSQMDNSSQDLPADASSQNSTTNTSSRDPSTEPSSQGLFTKASAQNPSSDAPSQNPSTEGTPRQKLMSWPSKPRKKKRPQPLMSTGSVTHQPTMPTPVERVGV